MDVPLPRRDTLTAKVLRCSACNEDRDSSTVIGRDCAICGGLITEEQRAIATADAYTEDNELALSGSFGFFEGLLDIMGGQHVMEAIEVAMMEAHSAKPISNEFLKSIGRVKIDARGGLLLDVTLRIGPYKAVLIPSGFSVLPIKNSTLTGRLIRSNPECGEGDILNESDMDGAIVIFKRGKVTFRDKALNAQRAGALAVIVCQTFDTWPFVMTDAIVSDDGVASELNIPVYMISKNDASILDGLVDNCRKGQAIVGDIIAEPMDVMCSICHDPFANSETVLKLPCRHMYHEDCVVSWLESHNTCPLCRLQMPQEKAEDSFRSGQRNEFDNASRQPYFK